MDHKFKLRQIVRLLQTGSFIGHVSPDGLYEVIRLMPQDQAGDFYYRLTSAAGERVAREGQITEDLKI